jgi:hypothetical protein
MCWVLPLKCKFGHYIPAEKENCAQAQQCHAARTVHIYPGILLEPWNCPECRRLVDRPVLTMQQMLDGQKDRKEEKKQAKSYSAKKLYYRHRAEERAGEVARWRTPEERQLFIDFFTMMGLEARARIKLAGSSEQIDVAKLQKQTVEALQQIPAQEARARISASIHSQTFAQDQNVDLPELWALYRRPVAPTAKPGPSQPAGSSSAHIEYPSGDFLFCEHERDVGRQRENRQRIGQEMLEQHIENEQFQHTHGSSKGKQAQIPIPSQGGNSGQHAPTRRLPPNISITPRGYNSEGSSDGCGGISDSSSIHEERKRQGLPTTKNTHARKQPPAPATARASTSAQASASASRQKSASLSPNTAEIEAMIKEHTGGNNFVLPSRSITPLSKSPANPLPNTRGIGTPPGKSPGSNPGQAFAGPSGSSGPLQQRASGNAIRGGSSLVPPRTTPPVQQRTPQRPPPQNVASSSTGAPPTRPPPTTGAGRGTGTGTGTGTGAGTGSRGRGKGKGPAGRGQGA